MSKQPPYADRVALVPDHVLDTINAALRQARILHPPYRSLMEAEAALREELDELTAAIREGYQSNSPTTASASMTLEAGHLAATAIRFLIDCPCPVNLPDPSDPN